MRVGLRVVLRILAALLLAAAAYLVVLQPKDTLAGGDLITKVSIGVQCSSLSDQWLHHTKPAAVAVGGQPVTPLTAAQSSCTSASHRMKEVDAGLVAGAVVAVGISFVLWRRRGRSVW
jgi:hypothetical protein